LSAAATIVCSADRAAGVSTMRCAYRSTRSCVPRDDSVGAYVAQQAGTHQFLSDLPHFVGHLARSLTDADQCHCAPNSGETPIHNGSRTFASEVSILLGRCGERCSKSGTPQRAAPLISVAIYDKPISTPLINLVLRERRIQGTICYTGDDYRAVIALMAQGHYDTTGWVDTIPMSGVLEQGFEELRAGRKMKLLVDPTV
jgi:hypothetical protein